MDLLLAQSLIGRKGMHQDSSRRNFLAAGLGLPAAGVAASRLPSSMLPALQPVAQVGQPAYRVLGKTGLKVSSVGMGCMITSDATVLEKAIDMGITYIDTARGYQSGNNERMVGTVLQGKRDKVILSTKSHARKGADALAELETSLGLLGTDHVDIWYMHAVDDPAEITDDLYEAWETAKQQGKIRFIGISTHNPNGIADRVLDVGKHEVLLSTYNFLVGGSSDASFDRFSRAGIGLVAMKVMAPAARTYGFEADPSKRMEREGGPLAALKWVLRNQNFATAIPSMVDTYELETNFKAMSEPFSGEDDSLLAAINEEVRPLYCRTCHQCSGKCPKGLPVANMIRFLSYSDFYGQFALGRERFLELPEQIRQVRCSDCGECTIQCPNGVHVADRLMRAQELFA